MYIHESHRSVFVAIPRTASRSIATWLMFRYGFRQVGTHHNVRHFDGFDSSAVKRYRWWTVVRSPYQRAESLYRLYSTEPNARDGWGPNSRRQKIRDHFEASSFGSFCEWLSGGEGPSGKREPSQWDILSRINPRVEIVKFEHLPKCLTQLGFVRDVPVLPRWGETPSKAVTWDDRAVEYVRDWAADDFREFEYQL